MAQSLSLKILSKRDYKTVLVECPEWECNVLVKELSVAEREKLTGLAKHNPDTDISPFVVVTCCVEEDGNPIFQAEDVEALRGKNAAVIDRIVKAAMILNNLDTGAEERAKKN